MLTPLRAGGSGERRRGGHRREVRPGAAESGIYRRAGFTAPCTNQRGWLLSRLRNSWLDGLFAPLGSDRPRCAESKQLAT